MRVPRGATKVALPVAVLLGVLVACSSGVTDSDSGWGGGTDKPSFSPGSALAAVGCTETEQADSGSVVLALVEGGRMLFDCSAVPEARWVRAYQRELTGRAAKLTGTAAMTGYYTYQIVLVEYDCSYTKQGPTVTGNAGEGRYVTWGLDPGGPAIDSMYLVGEFQLTFYVEVSATCTRIEYGEGTWHSGEPGDGDDGGSTSTGGGGTTPPPPPPPPPPSPDTCNSTGDSYLVLNSKGIQDSLSAILARSVAANEEMGGYIYKVTSGGPFMIALMPSDTSKTDNCSWASNVPPGTKALGMIFAYFHTHPTTDGTTFTCKLSGLVITASSFASGGGSLGRYDSSGNYIPGDWDWVRNATSNPGQVPMYTIDPQHIFRLEPGTPPGQEGSNPNNWTRVPGGCALP